MSKKNTKVTYDEGTTWTRVGPTIWSGHLVGIQFLVSGHGWMWNNRSIGYRTSDGAETWRGMRFFEAEVDFPRSLWFVSPTRGYAVYQDGEDRGAQELATTWDGGKHWRELQTWRP